MLVDKPWGNYITIHKDNNYLIKKITVNPKQRLSLQSHKHRSEHWTIVKGNAIVQIGKDIISLNANQYIFIPKETMHRIENKTDDTIEFIEVQYGEILDENDIIRFQDDYNRK